MEPLIVLEPEGLYSDDKIEQEIFASAPANSNPVKLIRGNLANHDAGEMKPLSALSDELCSSVHGLMVLKSLVTQADIERFPKLKVVVRMGVGYDRLDRPALAAKNIIVCNVPDYGTEEIADHAIALALSLRRGILLHHERQRTSAPWIHISTPLVSRIRGSTFGILGLGRIGTAVALRAKAFGWDVIFYDPYIPNGYDKSLGITRVRTIQDLFSRSKTLSIHCPNTHTTRGLVSDDLIALIPEGGILINTARGEIVDLSAVENALRSNRLAGAGLDVLPVEPIPSPPDVHPLIEAYRNKEDWLEGRLVITPHCAFYSPESWEDIRVKSAQTMRDVLVDGLRVNVIDPTDE